MTQDKKHVLKGLGLSLDEIRDCLDLYFEDPTGLRGKQKVLSILKTHLKETDEKLEALEAGERIDVGKHQEIRRKHLGDGALTPEQRATGSLGSEIEV